MKAKVSNAQTEVWDWKESIYRETKHLSLAERIEYLIKRAKGSALHSKKGSEKK